MSFKTWKINLENLFYSIYSSFKKNAKFNSSQKHHFLSFDCIDDDSPSIGKIYFNFCKFRSWKCITPNCSQPNHRAVYVFFMFGHFRYHKAFIIHDEAYHLNDQWCSSSLEIKAYSTINFSAIEECFLHWYRTNLMKLGFVILFHWTHCVYSMHWMSQSKFF